MTVSLVSVSFQGWHGKLFCWVIVTTNYVTCLTQWNRVNIRNRFILIPPIEVEQMVIP